VAAQKSPPVSPVRSSVTVLGQGSILHSNSVLQLLELAVVSGQAEVLTGGIECGVCARQQGESSNNPSSNLSTGGRVLLKSSLSPP